MRSSLLTLIESVVAGKSYIMKASRAANRDNKREMGTFRSRFVNFINSNQNKTNKTNQFQNNSNEKTINLIFWWPYNSHPEHKRGEKV